ncbi:glycosyltransferase family 4 protein [Paracoccus sp. Z330]|uniref:Glycosyltransferase family 4 protein n=1 Tax=Paracoccus onchidii TaxID=3017813 RepID=A0ABT4ZEJ0_9RHOB|nr:glycosyltransferase family 4 protein [Paracoccus onchidii]MDB6177759.1 glycosyltransferase family 4 protein [Paracoccus onchidii]
MIPCAFAIPGDIDTLTGGYLYEKRLLAGLRDLGHDMQHLELPASFPDAAPDDMAHAIRMLQAIDPDRPLILDGLVSGSIDPGGLAAVPAPVIAMVHHPLAEESGLCDKRRAQLLQTERENLRISRHVLVPSPHTRRILIDRYDVPPSKITVARPGIDKTRQPRVPVSPPLILSVGILHPRKGHDVLIAALGQIAHLDWQAVIVGNPWDRAHASALQDMVQASPVGARIHLAGRVSERRLQHLYARASVFALATRYEGYGIVFDEALLNGLPVVSCDTGAVPETLPPGTRLLTPTDDPAAFAAALDRILSDKPLRERLTHAAKRAGQTLPGWQDTAATASQVVEAVVSQGC